MIDTIIRNASMRTWPQKRPRQAGRFLLLPIVVLIGCGSDELSSPTAQQLRGLAAVYLDFAAAKGRGPENEQQLLRHVANVPAFVLGASKLTTHATESQLNSERDGEPFLIRYGVGVSQKHGRAAPIIACERKGKDGTRFVAFANGEIACIEASLVESAIREKF